MPALTTDELPESKDGAKVPEVLDKVEEISPPPVDAGSAKEEEEAKERYVPSTLLGLTLFIYIFIYLLFI